MPTYDYSCRNGHTVEERRGYDDTTIPCPLCPETAYRHPCYAEQFTITETGSVSGVRDRVRRDHGGEKLNTFYKNSVETTRESGRLTGPFKIPEKKTYGPRPNV